ncbi:est [Symbiodinium pilosum]|uniref:Est protein n=1 Tax=Symbiodinium pilosum TaxID=2952 RepID=A0A812R0B1_SYMPI|nr:est [Symbiodinium pilosum]
MCGGEQHRERVSPVCNDMTGLCPLYVSVSEHEVCLDENNELVEKAKKAEVEVTLDLVPHMPHAFQWCSAFLPESRESDDRIIGWMREKLQHKCM